MWCYQRLHFWRVMSWIYGSPQFVWANDFTLLLVFQGNLTLRCLWIFSLVNYPSSFRWHSLRKRILVACYPTCQLTVFWWKRSWGSWIFPFVLVNHQYTTGPLGLPQHLAPQAISCRQAECTIINFTVTEDGIWDRRKVDFEKQFQCVERTMGGSIKREPFSWEKSTFDPSCMVILRDFSSNYKA